VSCGASVPSCLRLCLFAAPHLFFGAVLFLFCVCVCVLVLVCLLVVLLVVLVFWLCLLCLCVCWPACLLFVIGLMSTLLTCNLASVKHIFSFCVILVVGAGWVLLLVCLVFGMCVVLGLSFALWCKSAFLSWIVPVVAAPPLFWGFCAGCFLRCVLV